jgi:hypothetical protein
MRYTTKKGNVYMLITIISIALTPLMASLLLAIQYDSKLSTYSSRLQFFLLAFYGILGLVLFLPLLLPLWLFDAFVTKRYVKINR